MKTTVLKNETERATSNRFSIQVIMEAITITKITAILMPTAVSTFLDTPRKGQIPKNRASTKLLTSIAERNIKNSLVPSGIYITPITYLLTYSF